MLGLRPYKRCDAERIVSWIGDERAFYKWCAGRYPRYPISAQDMNDKYDGAADSDDFFAMTAFDESGPVGHITLRYIDEKREEVRLGFVIVDKALRGKGYGKGMVVLATRYAREFLGAKRVTLGVFENNESAHRCYRAAGFVELPQETWYTVNLLGEDWRCIVMEARQ